MKKLIKVIVFLVIALVVVFAGLAFFIGTVDANKYRPQLVEMLSKKTGRAVKLNGPIVFSLHPSGLRVTIQDASIANPAWASRPVLAGMGKFELGVGLLPLLAHELSISELSIENADILLETNAEGQHNWDFAKASPTAAPAATASTPAPASSASKASVSIANLSIVNSQLAMRGADGKTSSYNVASFNLGMHGTGAELKFTGDINGNLINTHVTTNITDLLSKEPFTFDADATYSVIHFAAQGRVDIGGSKADVSAYEITAGKSKITGDLTATWNGPRPNLHGSMNSDLLNMADFKSNDSEADVAATAPTTTAAHQEPAAENKRMFSETPLPFSALKSADAELAVSVGEFPLGKSALKQIGARLTLAGGDLNLAPVKALVGTAPVEVQIKLNATQSPAHVTAGIIAKDVDLGDLQALGGMATFMTGKADANIQLTGDGNSAHEIASNLGGVITVTAEKGEILTGAAAGISSALAAVFSGTGGNNAINCLAARFIVKNGVMTDNGILIDSVASTVTGKGNVNLGTETVDMNLRAETKLVNVGGLVPALQIGGSLAKPTYSVDTAGVVKNVVGSLLNGDGSNFLQGSVPALQAAPAGQNACVYTLDHPKAAASSGVLPADPVGKANQKIKNIGNSLLKGLLGQ